MLILKNIYSAIKTYNADSADISLQTVNDKVSKIIAQINQIAKYLQEADQSCRGKIEYRGNAMCNSLGKYYLHEAEHNSCAYQETREKWKTEGNKWLATTIYDYMRQEKMLPPLPIQLPENKQHPPPVSDLARILLQEFVGEKQEEEDPEMLAQLRARIEQLTNSLEAEGRDRLNKDAIIRRQEEELQQQAVVIRQQDEELQQQAVVIRQQDEELQQKDSQISDLSQTVAHEKEVNQELTAKLNTSEEINAELRSIIAVKEEENAELHNKLAESGGYIVELTKRSADLCEQNCELKHDKQMLLEDRAEWKEEKKLLTADKKILHELYVEQQAELLELKHVHFYTEHCTILGHCNNPDHSAFNG